MGRNAEKSARTAPKTAIAQIRDEAYLRDVAGLAQLVEHLICNQGVTGSNPVGGTTWDIYAVLRLGRSP